MSSDHDLIWGAEGQDLIRNTKIAIVGLDNIGLETLKSAIMLGIGTYEPEREQNAGHIYLIDDIEKKGHFLDIYLPENKPRAESLQEMFKRQIFQTAFKKVKITGYNQDLARIDTAALRELNLDAIISATNDPGLQGAAIQFGKEYGVDVLLAACNKRDFELKQYFPNEASQSPLSLAKNRITQYDGQEQGLILSVALSGLLIEAFRKRLFIRNHEKISKEIYQKIKDEKQFNETMYYSLQSRDIKEENVGDLEIEADFSGKDFLICGCGAIGNAVTELLARIGARRIDFIDYDKVESRNLERQPLFYDYFAIPEFKAKILSEKVKRINSSINSNQFIGRVCEQGANIAETPFDLNWFAEHRYDVIFGCFDSTRARYDINNHATQLGLNYIDGGSLPTAGTVVTFVPGKTLCLECTLSISQYKEKAARSCSEVEPNVNMSNRIVGSLMLNEARYILNPSLGSPVRGLLKYRNELQGLAIIKDIEDNIPCPHYHADK